MAEAMVGRALALGTLTAEETWVADPVAERRRTLEGQYAVATTADNLAAARGVEMVVLAVKPQHLGKVFAELRGQLGASQTVLSIVAGTPIAALTSGLDHQQVIRVMPNTPARVGRGVSVWTATATVGEAARGFAGSLLDALGMQWYVEDEGYLDMATALSGSGPAYVFAFLEALADAGVHLGIPREMAMSMALETVLGSAALVKETGEHPALLREMVTSPGGTTAAALLVLERLAFRATVMEAVEAAYQKARELGRRQGGEAP